jgi:hypothetical protein
MISLVITTLDFPQQAPDRLEARQITGVEGKLGKLPAASNHVAHSQRG